MTTRTVPIQPPGSSVDVSSIDEVGMDVRIAVAKNVAQRHTKQSKSEVLNAFAMTVHGHCWMGWD